MNISIIAVSLSVFKGQNARHPPAGTDESVGMLDMLITSGPLPMKENQSMVGPETARNRLSARSGPGMGEGRSKVPKTGAMYNQTFGWPGRLDILKMFASETIHPRPPKPMKLHETPRIWSHQRSGRVPKPTGLHQRLGLVDGGFAGGGAAGGAAFVGLRFIPNRFGGTYRG